MKVYDPKKTIVTGMDITWSFDLLNMNDFGPQKSGGLVNVYLLLITPTGSE